MSSRAAPSYVRLRIDDETRQRLEIVHQKTGATINTEILRVALTYAAANMQGTLPPDGQSRRK